MIFLFLIYKKLKYFKLYEMENEIAKHPAQQALGSSTSLQLTQMCSFIWLSNIPLHIYIYTLASLSIHLGHLDFFHVLLS